MASLNRKEFLSALSSMPALATLGMVASSAQAAEEAERKPVLDGDVGDKTAEFADRVFDDAARMLCGALSYIGDRLLLFKAIHRLGKCTPEQLSHAVGCNERLVAEWLKGMMAYGYVKYTNAGTYHLSHAQAAVLADETSPFFMGGTLETTVPQVMATQEVLKAFRTGVPIAPSVFHIDLWEGIDRSNATTYQHNLVQNWLPEMSGVVARLKAGGTAVDVGCGQGNAVLVLARAFPKSRFHGYDPYPPSVEKARQAAEAAGVSERTEFVVGNAGDLPAGKFDLATSLLTVHHMSDPASNLASIRNALRAEGSYLIREDNLPNDFDKHTTPLARLAYSSSTLCCLHDSMANAGAALGPLTEARVRRLLRQAGFSKVRRLPIESAYDAFYEANA